jgi:hypothetical protein
VEIGVIVDYLALPSWPPTSGDRILACRTAPARRFRLVALSATVVAMGPAAWAGADEQPAVGWEADSVRFEPLTAGANGLTVAGTGTYRGAVEVRPNGRSLAVVNDVGFEDYVRGIDEVPASWPAAVLQAQAIAARTYAAHRAAAREDTPWKAAGADICATPRCQVYRGLDTERKARGHGWLPAVEATAGRVLLEADRPILASYSATANGPRAMSQNGARDMAMAGHSATQILAAYYGVTPTLAPRRLPARIRVAVDLGANGVRVAATRPFRVVSGDGVELAAPASGEWRVVQGPGGVRLLPPESQEEQASGTGADTVEQAILVRRPGRAVMAGAPLPRVGPWALTAAALLLAAGSGAITLVRRRRA